MAGNTPTLYGYVGDSNTQIAPYGTDQISFKAAFRRAKRNLGIPENVNTPKPIKVFDNKYENRSVRVFEGEHEGKLIVMHQEDKFGRNQHLHTATLVDTDGNLHPSPLEKGSRYNQHAGHIPEDMEGFKGKPKG